MPEIFGVRFREVGKISYLSYMGNDKLKVGDIVIAETKLGTENGKILVKVDTEKKSDIAEPTERIIRKATEKDIKSINDKAEEEKKAEVICREKIEEHKLNMKLIDVEYTFGRNKIIFYFVSDNRVDFRNLVKDLAKIFRVRIELHQVGIRDEAKMLGGLGPCGKCLCCGTFLNDFQPVSIKMAKDQGISLNPTKLSGLCGRLMCCLKYEEDTYRELLGNMPEIGQKVFTPEGEGEVVDRMVIKSQVKVCFEQQNTLPKVFDLNEIKVTETVSNE